MTPDINAPLFSIWQKFADGRHLEKSEKNEDIIKFIFEEAKENLIKIWRCGTEELLFLKQAFSKLETSNTLSRLLEQIDQAIDIRKAAQKNVRKTIKRIKQYNIDDQDRLFEIAKISLRNNAWATAMRIKDFGLTNQEQLCKIVKTCAEIDIIAATSNISNFGIRDQNRLFEIAKFCAKIDWCGGAINNSIKNFGISDQNQLFEIAKICAQKNPYGTITTLHKYGITDQHLLSEIAEICAKRNGLETAKAIEGLNIADRAKIRDIMLLAVEQNPLSAAYWKEENREIFADIFKEPLNFITAQRAVHSYIIKRLPGENFEELITRITDMTKITYSGTEGEQIMEEDIRYAQQNLFKHLAPTLLLLAERCDKEQIHKTRKFRLIEAIQDFRRPELRWDLTILFIAAVSQDALNDMATDGKKNSALRLINLLLISLIQRGADREESLKIAEIIKNDRGLLKNAVATQNIIESLLNLIKEQSLTAGQCRDVVKRLTEEAERATAKRKGKTLLIDLRSINSLILMKRTNFLTKPNYTFNSALKDGFRSIIPFKDIDNFNDKFFAKFGSSRNPMAITTYAAKIASLNNEPCAKTLGRFIEGVMEGTFKIDRNSVENNIHLKTIMEKDGQAFKKWQKMLDPISSDEVSASPVAQFSAEDWLRVALIDNRHLQALETKLPTLFNYLNRKDKEVEIKECLEQIKKRRLLESKKIADKQFIFLDVEQICFRIMQLSNTASIIEQLNRLGKKLLLPPFNNPEFLNDVCGLAETMSKMKKKSDSSSFIATETEEYLDLLLCGTEVMGSCQRVDGNPTLNKGLLGYLLDGKNHLLVIKSKKGDTNRIEARCLLKLLWDGEKAVLFLEKIYPYLTKSEHKAALYKLAALKARILDRPLLCSEEQGKNYPRTVYALGGPAPFEYSDACRGLRQNGKYAIEHAKFFE